MDRVFARWSLLPRVVSVISGVFVWRVVRGMVDVGCVWDRIRVCSN